MRIAGRALLLWWAAMALPAQAAGPTIDWKLVDRFRLFDQADTPSKARFDEVLDSIAVGEAGTLLPHYEPILKTLSGDAAQPFRQSNWDRENRRYKPEYLAPKPFRIAARLMGGPSGRMCHWRVQGAEATDAVEDCSRTATLTVEPAFFDRDPRGAARPGVQGELIATVAGSGESFRVPLRIRDELIVALGDSFISGEGNPDVPVTFGALAPTRTFALAQWPDKIHRLPASSIREAEWWDEPCHRSLLSWPVLASIYRAAKDPHKAVTLVHLGCSGAEIGDGLLTPQVGGLPGCPDKGERRNCPLNPKRPKPKWGAERPVYQDNQSQIEMLENLLAASGRRIDHVFLSIGGNDIGFVGVIKYLAIPPNGYVGGALIPRFLLDFGDAGIVCPREGNNSESTVLRRFCSHNQSAESRLKLLPAAFETLQAKLQTLVDLGNVYQTAYPNILEDEPGPQGETRYCHHALRQHVIDSEFRPDSARYADETAYLKAHPERVYPHGFEAMQGVLPPLLRWRTRWSFHLRHPAGSGCPEDVEASDSEICKGEWVWKSLNGLLSSGSADASDNTRMKEFIRHAQPPFVGPYKWQVVTSHVPVTRGHGWCRADARHDPLELPVAARDPATGRLGWKNGRQPKDYDPYPEKRERWFRTTNDSVLTQYGGKDRFQNGTIHPTYREHIAVADAVIQAMPRAGSAEQGCRAGWSGWVFAAHLLESPT